MARCIQDCGGINATVDDVEFVLNSVQMPQRVIQSIVEIRDKEDMPLPFTPGKWFRISMTDHALASILADEYLEEDENRVLTLKEAFHGTSIDNLPMIVARGLQEGPHSIVKKTRVYCEGSHRRNCTLGYMTHVSIPGLNPMWMWAAQLECLVDRERGGTKHNQWHQQQGSVHVVSINIHVFNLRDAYNKGNVGWFKVHKPLMRHGLRLCQLMSYNQLCTIRG